MVFGNFASSDRRRPPEAEWEKGLYSPDSAAGLPT